MNSLAIRPARPDDAPEAARLLQISGTGIFEALFDSSEEETVRALARLFAMPGHALSHSYTFVAGRDGETIGMLLGFDDRRWSAVVRGTVKLGLRWFTVVRPWRFPRFLLAFRDLYHLPDDLPPMEEGYAIEWLAVAPHARRQGIATCLLDFATGQARAGGLRSLKLDVLIENEGARRLYARYGFQEVHTVIAPRFTRRFGSQGYVLMVKPL